MSDAAHSIRPIIAAPGESPSGEVTPARPLLVTLFILLMAVIAVSSAFLVPRTTDVVVTDVLVTGDQRLDLSFPDGGCLVSGKVLGPGGDRMMGVNVEVIGYDGLLSQGTVTGVRGTFQVPVRPGIYRVSLRPTVSIGRGAAAPSRLLPASAGPFTVKSDTWIGTITLQKGFLVPGRINTVARPAEHVYGWLTAVPAEEMPDGTPAVIPIGSLPGSTRFQAVLPAGRFTLLLTEAQAFAANWSMLPMSSYGTGEVAVSSSANAGIDMGTGARLRGTVRDAADRPLSGSLWIQRQVETGAPQDRALTVITVMRGAYITHLPPGSYAAAFLPLADSTGSGRGTRTLLSIEMGVEDRDVLIMVADGFIISGRIRDARGVIRRATSVEAIPRAVDSHSLASLPIRAVADEETGTYRLCVPAGRYDFHAAQAGMDNFSTFARLLLGGQGRD